ncbi:sensor histidine kinase [Nocardioides euryhalodurans]|uniref:histidine kinase n=1 Tax=Nocardioides euryhalodurans TaxID=2518370 RepID=A0A4P7GIS1_9ACTN|nr:ATP-binding protein [Nocardioides euryhalodurans]QBR91617.1 PAS domain-containing sensor histidine kinase [Nocardioides euryhalodurans]
MTEHERERATAAVGWRARLDGSDPVALQVVFTALIAFDLAVRVLAGRIDSFASWPVAALLVALAALVLSVAAPWDRLPAGAVAVVPVIDIAVVGVSRLASLGAGAGLLVLIPAYWLGRAFGRRGILVTLVAGVLTITIPGLLVLEPTGDNISRSVLVPALGTWAAWAAQALSSTLGQLRREREVAELDRDRLSVALDTIEHQRRVSDAILDTVDVGLLLLDDEGRYQSMNRRHRDFMALSFPDGHRGRAGQMGLIYDESGTSLLTGEQMPTTRAAAGEEFDDFRIWVGDDPLTSRALSVSARSVRDPEGRFVGAALAYKDVTEFMRALRVKDEFVASVSHELRTPLTSIRGYVDLLMEEDGMPEEAVRQLAVVARNAERLGRLVADLLQSAQIDLGPMRVVRTRGDLAATVRETVAAAAPAAASVGVTLDADLPDALVMMMDRDRMRQVADNLVSNAIKYTPRGGKVHVRLGVDGERVELSVEDTGIGIGARDRDQLFTRFFRSRQAEEQSIQGIGLGLSITKSIVESHGGRIEVDSEVGRGSTFRVRLPLGVEAAADR